MAEMDVTRIASLSRGNVVRVSVPAKIAFDLGEFNKLVEGLAERLGCLPCLSGAVCLFDFERFFGVDPAGKLEAQTPIGF
jgi:hypothetical protein